MVAHRRNNRAILRAGIRQIQVRNVTVTKGYYIDASITHSPRKPRTKPAYEVVHDRDDETGAQSVFCYKQYTRGDNTGLVVAVETAAANRHDSQPMLRCWIKLE